MVELFERENRTDLAGVLPLSTLENFEQATSIKTIQSTPLSSCTHLLPPYSDAISRVIYALTSDYVRRRITRVTYIHAVHMRSICGVYAMYNYKIHRLYWEENTHY